MKKLFIIIITSFSFLFIIWTLEIAIQNNFDLHGIRFSFKATIMQLQDIDAENFKELTNNIYIAIKTYQLQEQVANQNAWLQLGFAQSWLGTLGVVVLNVLKYILAELGMLFQILNFIFNPITY